MSIAASGGSQAGTSEGPEKLYNRPEKLYNINVGVLGHVDSGKTCLGAMDPPRVA